MSLGAATATWSEHADAQSTNGPRVDPRTLLDRALAEFRAGNFRPALQQFQLTFELTGNPAILFNIAVTWQRLGEPGEAARALRRFLVAQPQAPNRAEVERQIRTLEEEDAHLHPAAVVASAQPSASSAPPSQGTITGPRVESHQRSIIGPVAVTAIGGAALVTGIVFFALREGALGSLRTMCTTTTDPWHCDDTAEARARYSDAQTFTTVSLVTGIVGVVAIAGGITWMLLPTGERRASTARVGFGADANGGAITLQGSF